MALITYHQTLITFVLFHSVIGKMMIQYATSTYKQQMLTKQDICEISRILRVSQFRT